MGETRQDTDENARRKVIINNQSIQHKRCFVTQHDRRRYRRKDGPNQKRIHVSRAPTSLLAHPVASVTAKRIDDIGYPSTFNKSKRAHNEHNTTQEKPTHRRSFSTSVVGLPGRLGLSGERGHGGGVRMGRRGIARRGKGWRLLVHAVNRLVLAGQIWFHQCLQPFTFTSLFSFQEIIHYFM